MSEDFNSEEQDRNNESDKNAAFFPQKLQSSYQNPTQNQMQLFSNLFGTFNDSGSLDTALEALEGMANLPIASQGNDYSVKLKIGDYPVVTGKVEPDVIRPMTGWEAFKWDLGKVVPYIPYVNVLNDAKIALTGSDIAGYYASPGEQQDAKFQTVLNVATVGTGGLLGAELKSLRGATEEIGVVSKGLSNAAAGIEAEAKAGRSFGKTPWGSWADYEKITVDIEGGTQTYANVGDRLYSKHAVDRMQPSGNRFGHPIAQAGGDYGRSVSPEYVEEVLRSAQPILQENGNLSYVFGSVEVITNKMGAVITIITK